MEKEKLPVKIIIAEKEYGLDYLEELKCSEDTINDDLKNQSAQFAWYSVLSGMQEEEYGQRKLELELIEAELDSHYRKELDKVTEAKVAMQIRSDLKYIEARQIVNEAKKNLEILKGITEAFRHRKDMLVTLAANMRVQSDPELYIRREKYKDGEITYRPEK